MQKNRNIFSLSVVSNVLANFNTLQIIRCRALRTSSSEFETCIKDYGILQYASLKREFDFCFLQHSLYHLLSIY